jgi:hypothetical protein
MNDKLERISKQVVEVLLLLLSGRAEPVSRPRFEHES